MISWTVSLSISGAGRLAKLMVLKCFSCHFCPPFGSAAFFSEIANLRVKTGVRLESEHEGQQLEIRDRNITTRNVQSTSTSREGWYFSAALSPPTRLRTHRYKYCRSPPMPCSDHI